MSQENVEVAHRAFQAWNAGAMDTFGELLDPSVSLRSPEGWPEPGPFVGRERVMRQFEQMRGTWEADRLEPIGDFIDAGDRVAVRYVWHGVGQGPDAKLELTMAFTMRTGRVVGLEFFWDHAEALEAVGPSE